MGGFHHVNGPVDKGRHELDRVGQQESKSRDRDEAGGPISKVLVSLTQRLRNERRKPP